MIFLEMSKSHLLFPNWIIIVSIILRNLQEEVKKTFGIKNCTDLLLLEQLFLVITQFCKFSAFCIKVQKFFWINRTILSNSRTEQFWKQNTISLKTWKKCLLGRGKKMACCWLWRPNGNQKPLLQTAQRNLSWGFFSCLLIAIDTFNHAFMTVFFFILSVSRHKTRLLLAFDKNQWY